MRHPVLYVATALALLAAGLFPASAQEAPVKIGVVDLELVGLRFERKIKAEEQLTAWYRQQGQYLRELSRYIFCTAPEWEEVDRLLATPKAERKPEQETRLTALLDQSTQREREYKDLEAKAERTKDEEDRFQLLLEIGQTRNASVEERAAGLDKQLEERMRALRAELMEPVKAVINTLAAERGFTVVLEKDWVYFGGEDITEEVITRLNAQGPPAEGPADQPGADEKPEEGGGDKPAEGGGNP